MYKSQIEPVYLLFCTRRRSSDVSWQKSGGNEGVKLPDSALHFLSKLLVTSLLNNRKKNIHVSWHLQASMERETWSPLWCKCRGENWKRERLRKKKKDQPEGSIASFFSFPLLVRIDLAKNKPGRTPLRSRCIHRWPNRPKCHIRCSSHYPTCVYLCGNRAAVCQKQRVCRCFLPTETRTPKHDCAYGLTGAITSNKRLDSV